MKYYVATSQSPGNLSEHINKMIEEGWNPIGGVSSTAVWFTDHEGFSHLREEYTQAMVKEEDPECCKESEQALQLRECREAIARMPKP